MEKKDKYDTNPLDPNHARRTNEVWGAGQGGGAAAAGGTEEIGGATRDVARTANEQARSSEGAEAPTRRYSAPPASASSYPSV